MQAALRSRLLADATVAGLVGTRVDCGLRPQGKPLPAITLTLVSSPRGYRMDGAQETQQHRVQIDCWGATYKSSDDVRNAVVACLEAASGAFQASFLIRNSDMPERTETGEMHRASLDFKVTHISA